MWFGGDDDQWTDGLSVVGNAGCSLLLVNHGRIDCPVRGWSAEKQSPVEDDPLSMEWNIPRISFPRQNSCSVGGPPDLRRRSSFGHGTKYRHPARDHEETVLPADPLRAAIVPAQWFGKTGRHGLFPGYDS